MVTEATKRLRELSAWVLVAIPAVQLIAIVLALFADGDFTDKAVGLLTSPLAQPTTSVLMGVLLAAAVLVTTHAGGVTPNARAIGIVAVIVAGVLAVVGLINLFTVLAADSVGVFSQSTIKVGFFLIQLAAVAGLGLAGLLGIRVLQVVPGPLPRFQQYGQPAPVGPLGQPYGQFPGPYGPAAGYAATPYGQGQYGQAQYGPAPYGQAAYGQAAYGQAPYGQTPYGPGQYGQPYGQAPYDQPQHPQHSYQPGPYGQAPYGQPQYEQPQYGPAGYGQPAYQQAPYGQAPYGQPQYEPAQYEPAQYDPAQYEQPQYGAYPQQWGGWDQSHDEQAQPEPAHYEQAQPREYAQPEQPGATWDQQYTSGQDDAGAGTADWAAGYQPGQPYGEYAQAEQAPATGWEQPYGQHQAYEYDQNADQYTQPVDYGQYGQQSDEVGATQEYLPEGADQEQGSSSDEDEEEQHGWWSQPPR